MPGMQTALTHLPSLAHWLRRVESAFRQGADRHVESNENTTRPDSSLLQFHSALGSVHHRCVMSERLARKSGNEDYEFLIAVRSFDEARNPLQRYQLLSNIIHRFVRRGAERAVRVSEACRTALLAEFEIWDERGRIPARLRFRALETAAIEVNLQLATPPAAALSSS